MNITNTRAIYFPYCLKQLEDKTWVLLNRNYKPLGTDSIVKYEDIPESFRIAKITPKQAQALSFESVSEAKGTIYLYDEGRTVPTGSKKNMDAYLKRLSVLITLKLKK
jgi:hypothetical protein